MTWRRSIGDPPQITVVRDVTDDRGRRRVTVEPATHTAPEFPGWECRFTGYVGGRHPGDRSYTTFSYRREGDA